MLLKAKAEARLRERKRVREITELVRKEAQMKLKYHVALAQKQIREDLNERVKEEVKGHARMQKASLSPCDGGEAMLLVVKQQPDGTPTFRKRLEKKELARYRNMFAHWDENQDGAISYPEFVAVMKVVTERQGRPYSEKKVQAMFGLADLDKNGVVDFEEFVVMQAGGGPRP